MGNPLTGNAQSPRPAQQKTAFVSNDGWWPDIDMAHLREAVSIPGGVTDIREVTATCIAIRDVNNELHDWKAAQVAAGYTNLLAVPAALIDEESELLVSYTQAIFETVDADLCEKYRKMDTTGAGDKRADMLDERINTARRNVRWAVNAIIKHQAQSKGKPHRKIFVELV